MTEPWGAPPGPRQERGRPYGQQPAGRYAGQEQDFSRRQPSTPYLDRDPYKQLSEENLEREAYPAQYGGSEQFDRGSEQFGRYGSEEPYGRRRESSGTPRSRQRPVKQSNGVALAGALLFFVPLLGLILSIVGRAMARARGGAGKTSGTVGIVLSLLFTGGLGFAVYKVAASTAADPACISAESDVLRLSSTLSTDENAVTAAEKSGDKATFVAAGNKFTADARSLTSEMESAQAKATHSDVRSAIQNFDTDLAAFATGMQQVLGGNTSNEAATSQAVNRLSGDGDAIDKLCGNVTNG